MRSRYKWDSDLMEMVEIYNSENELHYVIQDTMPPTLCPADGKIYESKSAYRRAVKAKGLVEFGNDLTVEDFAPPKISDVMKIDERKMYAFLNGDADGRVKEIIAEQRYLTNKKERR